MDALPTPNLGNTNPKVTASAIYGGLTGAGLANLLIWFMQDGLHMAAASFTPDRVIGLTAACTSACGFIAGWLKKHNIEV